MRNSSDPDPAPPRRRRDRLEVAIIINQLATPGLGSWIAGHRLAGAGQLLLSCTGFVLFLGYCVRLVIEAWRASEWGVEPTPQPAGVWQGPLALFGIAWVWSAITSFQMWRESRRKTTGNPADTPPRLT